MNDRLKIASEQLAALLLAAADHGVTDCQIGMTQAEFLVGAALSYADALIAAAGEQEKNDGWHALSARQHDAIRELEAKCAALEAENANLRDKLKKQDAAAGKLMDACEELTDANARLRRQAEPLTDGEWNTLCEELEVFPTSIVRTFITAADRIRSRRSSDG